MITNCPEVAAYAIDSGVDRIFVDLEVVGKKKRQGHLSTVISNHSLNDVKLVRKAVPPGRLLVRINPIHENSIAEINDVIDAGADILMLPMFRDPDEVKLFVDAIGQRARSCLLIETADAASNLYKCIQTPGINEVHIGLNDLHLELELDFMFEPLANGMIDDLCTILRQAGISFGIGGIARVGEGLLPAELLLSEHVRLGSSGAILSRTFHRMASTVNEIKAQMNFPEEIAKLRSAYTMHLQKNPQQLIIQHNKLKRSVDKIVKEIQNKKTQQNIN